MSDQPAAFDTARLETFADGVFVSDWMANAITRRYLFGPTMYFLATILAFVSVPVSLGIIIALAILFLLPYRSSPTK